MKVAVHRLRQRYRELLRVGIAETVSDPSDIDDEMRFTIRGQVRPVAEVDRLWLFPTQTKVWRRCDIDALFRKSPETPISESLVMGQIHRVRAFGQIAHGQNKSSDWNG